MAPKPGDQFSALLVLSLIGSLLLLTSYIALNENFISNADTHHDHSRIKHLERFVQILPDNFTISLETSIEHSFHAIFGDHAPFSPLTNVFHSHDKTSWVGHNHSEIHGSESSKIHEAQSNHIFIEDSCKLSFPPKCKISPYVKYWDDHPDCFDRPLRNVSGFSQPDKTKRKYVVFQSDLGGWNNIRMALEVVILFAYASGRILVLPPDAVLYLLNRNKKWDHNKSGMEDYIDFTRLANALNGLEIMSMEEFLATVALPGLLANPLPNNDIHLMRKPLWEYLESSCYVRQWSPGKTFISFNVTKSPAGKIVYGNISDMISDRYTKFAIGRQPIIYDEELDSHRAIYFPGHEENRLLTHFYSMIYFPDIKVHKMAKRFMRDRVRYLDEIFCGASKIVTILDKMSKLYSPSDVQVIGKPIDGPKYVAYHIRRGEFQQTHTRLDAALILNYTYHLIPDISNRILYISTDESNRTFFKPFFDTFKDVKFLSDFHNMANIDEMNPNHLGMVEQIICAAADIFIGTPLSTFTAYITRMRGYMNDSMMTYPVNRLGHYKKTYYFMKSHMYRLHEKPNLSLPFWVRDFIEPFEGINT